MGIQGGTPASANAHPDSFSLVTLPMRGSARTPPSIMPPDRSSSLSDPGHKPSGSGGSSPQGQPLTVRDDSDVSDGSEGARCRRHQPQ